MDPVSNVDRLLVILRHKLQERSKTAPAPSKSKAGTRAAAPVERHAISALVALENVDERQMRRALIQTVLGDHFGNEVINHAEFQQVVDKVTGAIEGDSGAMRILNDVVERFRLRA